jgi:hypothetical protein
MRDRGGPVVEGCAIEREVVPLVSSARVMGARPS